MPTPLLRAQLELQSVEFFVILFSLKAGRILNFANHPYSYNSLMKRDEIASEVSDVILLISLSIMYKLN